MKRLSLLIAILLVATIGGVYASWTYTDASSEIKGNGSVGLSLSAATEAGAAGSFAISENITSLEISETGVNDKTAQLVATYEAGASNVKIGVTFTPAATANDDIKTNGVEAYVYFGTNDNITWEMDTDENGSLESANLFKFAHAADATAIKINKVGGADYAWTNQGESFFCELNLSLDEFIALGGIFKLENINDYNAFETAMKGSKPNAGADIHIHVTTVNPAA